MKKGKLLLPTLGLVAMTPSVVPLMVSCNNPNPESISIVEPKTGDKKYLKWHLDDVEKTKTVVFSGFKFVGHDNISETSLLVETDYQIDRADIRSYISNIVKEGGDATFDVTVEITPHDEIIFGKTLTLVSEFEFYYDGELIPLEDHNDYEIVFTRADFIDISTAYHEDYVKMQYNDGDDPRASGFWRFTGISYSGLDGVEGDIADIHDLWVGFVSDEIGPPSFMGGELDNIDVYQRKFDIIIPIIHSQDGYGVQYTGHLEFRIGESPESETVDVVGENEFSVTEYAKNKIFVPEVTPNITFDASGFATVKIEGIKYRGYDDPESYDPEKYFVSGKVALHDDISVYSGKIDITKKTDPTKGKEGLYGLLNFTLTLFNKNGPFVEEIGSDSAFIGLSHSSAFPLEVDDTMYIPLYFKQGEIGYIGDDSVVDKTEEVQMEEGPEPEQWQDSYSVSFVGFDYQGLNVEDPQLTVVPHLESTNPLPSDALVHWIIVKDTENEGKFITKFIITFKNQTDIHTTYNLSGWLDFVYHGSSLCRSKDYQITLTAVA